MADRGRQAEAEAKQLQEAAERALEEVKQGARSTIEEMAARHAEDLDTERRSVSSTGRVVLNAFELGGQAKA